MVHIHIRTYIRETLKSKSFFIKSKPTFTPAFYRIFLLITNINQILKALNSNEYINKSDFSKKPNQKII